MSGHFPSPSGRDEGRCCPRVVGCCGHRQKRACVNRNRSLELLINPSRVRPFGGPPRGPGCIGRGTEEAYLFAPDWQGGRTGWAVGGGTGGATFLRKEWDVQPRGGGNEAGRRQEGAMEPDGAPGMSAGGRGKTWRNAHACVGKPDNKAGIGLLGCRRQRSEAARGDEPSFTSKGIPSLGPVPYNQLSCAPMPRPQ